MACERWSVRARYGPPHYCIQSYIDNGTIVVYIGTMDTTNSSTIKVNLPQGILNNSKQEADRIGISVQDFIRMLLGTYFSRSESITSISRDKVLLDSAKKDIANGAYTTVHTQKELTDHLLSL